MPEPTDRRPRVERTVTQANSLFDSPHTELSWLQRQLARFTYKPSWTMEARGGHGPIRPAVRITYQALDSRGTGRTVPVSGTFSIPDYFAQLSPEHAEGEFAEWLAYALREAEMHESREWLRRDGQIYDDPHASS